MSWSAPAGVLAIVYIIVTLLNIIISIRQKEFGGVAIFFTMLWIALAVLIVYDTACLTEGQCTVWSWVRTCIYAVLPILLIVAFMSSLTNAKEAQKDDKKKVKTEDAN